MGKLFIVGLGPGHFDGMTGRAVKALEAADLICGYTKYVELVKPHFSHKQYLATGMTSEIDRCRAAINAAKTQTVAIVSSGDAGVYGMAGLIYELAADEQVLEIEVIPGVTAAQSGASVLGAPLMQDYAVISLSDLLVSWETIEKRLRGAGAGDFNLVLYNPSSHKRAGHLKRACDILLEYRSGETVCGLVSNIGREGECGRVLTLLELRGTAVDMFTTVFIGSSATRQLGGKMVTPRGYEGKA
jgi:precorrin-3B C17-methyltransferase